MVKLCVVYGCNSTAVKGITLHEFPKDVERCRQWVQFVQRTRVWESKPRTSHICSKHFCKEAISNYMQVEMGVAKRLVLTEDAVPTIYPSIESESATTSTGNEISDTAEPGPTSASQIGYRETSCCNLVSSSGSESPQPSDKSPSISGSNIYGCIGP